MLFQVLCGFEPIFYTTHPNEEPFLVEVCVVSVFFTSPTKRFQSSINCCIVIFAGAFISPLAKPAS